MKFHLFKQKYAYSSQMEDYHTKTLWLFCNFIHWKQSLPESWSSLHLWAWTSCAKYRWKFTYLSKSMHIRHKWRITILKFCGCFVISFIKRIRTYHQIFPQNLYFFLAKYHKKKPDAGRLEGLWAWSRFDSCCIHGRSFSKKLKRFYTRTTLS